ncbi:MAG: FtsX-like permease family protein [Bacillota bacterium]
MCVQFMINLASASAVATNPAERFVYRLYFPSRIDKSAADRLLDRLRRSGLVRALSWATTVNTTEIPSIRYVFAIQGVSPAYFEMLGIKTIPKKSYAAFAAGRAVFVGEEVFDLLRAQEGGTPKTIPMLGRIFEIGGIIGSAGLPSGYEHLLKQVFVDTRLWYDLTKTPADEVPPALWLRVGEEKRPRERLRYILAQSGLAAAGVEIASLKELNLGAYYVGRVVYGLLLLVAGLTLALVTAAMAGALVYAQIDRMRAIGIAKALGATRIALWFEEWRPAAIALLPAALAGAMAAYFLPGRFFSGFIIQHLTPSWPAATLTGLACWAGAAALVGLALVFIVRIPADRLLRLRVAQLSFLRVRHLLVSRILAFATVLLATLILSLGTLLALGARAIVGPERTKWVVTIRHDEESPAILPPAPIGAADAAYFERVRGIRAAALISYRGVSAYGAKEQPIPVLMIERGLPDLLGLKVTPFNRGRARSTSAYRTILGAEARYMLGKAGEIYLSDGTKLIPDGVLESVPLAIWPVGMHLNGAVLLVRTRAEMAREGGSCLLLDSRLAPEDLRLLVARHFRASYPGCAVPGVQRPKFWHAEGRASATGNVSMLANLCMLLIAAAVAAVCAALYALTGQSVHARRNEARIKIALGASPRRAGLELLGETFETVFLGCLAGTLPPVAGLPFLQKFMGAFVPYFELVPWIVSLSCFVLFSAVTVFSASIVMREKGSVTTPSARLRF